MRKSWFYILILSLLCTLTNGQTTRFSQLEISAGGCWSNAPFQYASPQESLNVNCLGNWNGNLHLGYAYFFTPTFGIGFGAEMSYFKMQTDMNGEYVWEDVTDTDGEMYAHHTAIDHWHDNQQTLNVAFSADLRLHYPIGKVLSIEGMVGGKYRLPLSSNGRYSGDLTHTGFYEPHQLTLFDLPPYGFYSTRMEGNYLPKANNQFCIYAKAGVEINLTHSFYLFAHLTAEYDLESMFATSEQNKPLGFINDRIGQQNTHYFMTPYTSLLDTEITQQSNQLFSLGLEIGICWHIPHRRTTTCRCLKYM